MNAIYQKILSYYLIISENLILSTKIVMSEKGVIHIKISPLQCEKVAAKLIYVVKDIKMLMCLNKQTLSLINNFTQQRSVSP